MDELRKTNYKHQAVVESSEVVITQKPDAVESKVVAQSPVKTIDKLDSTARS